MKSADFQYDVPPHIDQDEYLINGQLKTWFGPYQTVTTPISTSLEPEAEHDLGHYPLLTEDVAKEVLESAERAYDQGQGLWPTLHPLERSASVRRFVKHMIKERSTVIKLLMWEVGKSYKDAASEFDRTVEYIQETIAFYEQKVKRLNAFQKIDQVAAQIQFSPRGICLCMGPYNYPLNETFTILIPALIAGNVVIFKPPRLGVLLHQPLLQPLAECFPPGVVNTIYGEGQKVISPLMKSGKIDVFAFIGSSKVADIIKSQHPYPHRLHTILGLEAKNPAIIYNDCQLDTAVNECLLGSLSYNGQRCTALKIIFVHQDIADQFVTAFASAVDQLKIGLPWEPDIQITPLPETAKVDYLNSLVEDAMSQGARKVNQYGGLISKTRFFPVVLYPVSLKSRIAHEEQFGPIVPIVPFEDFKEIEKYILNSNYGQQLSVFTSSERHIAQVMQSLAHQVSRININSQCQRGPDTLPFTGRKDSAQGVLSVREAIRAFSTPLVVAGKRNRLNNGLFQKTFNLEQRLLHSVWQKLKK